jgi:hypothetical protein
MQKARVTNLADRPYKAGTLYDCELAHFSATAAVFGGSKPWEIMYPYCASELQARLFRSTYSARRISTTSIREMRRVATQMLQAATKQIEIAART